MLHSDRLQAVVDALCRAGVSQVVDLGCGPGLLLSKLAALPQFTSLTGLDLCEESLRLAAVALCAQGGGDMPGHVVLRRGSLLDIDENERFEAAVLVETIEHINPDRLSVAENAVFGRLSPDFVVLTTPNRDYNPILGVPATRLRHPDHRFEWGRDKFESWGGGVARRHGYGVTFHAIGGHDPFCGGPTQMAVFRKTGSGLAA